MKALKSSVHVQFLALLLSIPHSASWGQGTECPPGCGPGRWANEAINLSSAPSKAPEQTRYIRVTSPDHQKTAHILKEKWWIEIGGARISPERKASSIFYPAELAWAPDSRALYITESFGYTTGYRVLIFRLENDELRQVHDVNKAVQRDFERRHKCSEGQLANVAGLRWVDDSQHLLIVAEVPPIGGICTEMNYFGGYLVSVANGQIIERYNPQAVKDRWEDSLGYRLKGDFDLLSLAQRTTIP
jgi:hypothetical protein